MNMSQQILKKTPRAIVALLLAVLMMGLSFAGTTPATVTVTDLSELATALYDAASSGDATTINFAAGTIIDIGSASANIPSNVAINLSGGTLRVSGGTLSVTGTISGGGIELVGGTLLRQSGSSITATITVSSGGTVRGPMALTLENLDTGSGESITSLSYSGESGSDTSSYVTRSAMALLYTQMTGSNYSVYKTIDVVTTSAGNVFRLGTQNTSTLSLTYMLSYSGLTGAKLAKTNPTSYTASDASFTLVNPTKDGYTFVGWTCAALSITVPVEEMVIRAGSSGDLTFAAVWVESASGGGMGGSGGGSSVSTTDTDTTADAETAQNSAAANDTGSTTTTKRVKQASSSTKVTFTSETNPVMPTLNSIEQPSSSFPWGWVFGGLGLLGIAAYALAKLIERKKNG